MKITLINLPAKRFRFTTLGILPPLGLGYIAAVLLRDGHKVNIIDVPAAGISIDKFRLMVRNDKSDLYGISSTLFGFQDVIRFSDILRQENSKIPIVLGGLCTVLPADIILKNIPNVDIVVSGEGEMPMQRVCDFLRDGKDIGHINGIAFRYKGEIIRNNKNEYMNLDAIPFPAYQLLDIKRYHLHPPFGLYSPVISMEISRGCTFNCEFCCLSKNYRTRNIEYILDEIIYLKKKYNVNEIYFVDHTFTISQEYIQNICQKIIDKNIKIHWTCKTRVDCVSLETLKLMKAAGCYMISYGVESGSEKILQNLNKGIVLNDIEKAIGLTRKCGIRSVAYMIIGSPGETKSTVKESLRLIRKIKPDYVLYNALAPDPASNLYNKAINEKVLSKDFFDAFIFSDASSQWPLYATSEFTRSDIEYWVKKATKGFYLNIIYILKCFMKIRTFREIKVILNGAIMLVADILFKKREDIVEY